MRLNSKVSTRFPLWLVGLIYALGISATLAASDDAPLVSLEYRVLGVQLQVSPAAVAVPKGIAGSVLVKIVSGDGTSNHEGSSLAEGAYVEGILRGPSFPARRLVGRPNEALLLPVLNLVGDYQLDNIRLVDAVTGAVRLEGSPASIPIRVFDEVLISRVTSRPLTMQEITDKGIVVDQANFRAVEFEVGFVLDGKTIPLKFPVVAPDFRQTTEIIPAAEFESRAREAQRINEVLIGQVMESGSFPEEFQRPQLNLQIKGIAFQQAGGGDPEDLRLGIPPIPALMVIPGNIGYLNQFFSVQIFTENGAPNGSGLSVYNVRAKMKLPPGPDGILSTNYLQPGDDPLRFARVGTAATNAVYEELPLVGTADSKPTRFYPGEGGQAEFLVEGLQEGLHVMDLDLTADLEGLSAGIVKIAGKASGSVLVRNPKFSLTFSHPKTIRSGEPYVAYVTVLNTSEVEANQLSITLRAASISGGLLESPESVQLGNVQPGQTVTAQFRVRAQRTGSVKFSNLTFGEEGIRGKFNLSMGIDERGVELSPDSLGYPEYVNYLPPYLLDAANRVLGQALSVATAPLLPRGVKPVSRSIITRRLLELAEAGQRLKLFDATNRVGADILLDWHGGRGRDAGFEQILRETNAGYEFRTALARFLDEADSLDAAQRLANRSADIAGRGESWAIAASSTLALLPTSIGALAQTTDTNSSLAGVAPYPGSRGAWVVARDQANLFRWVARSAVASAELRAVIINTNGLGRQWEWTVSGVPTGTCFTFNPKDPEAGLSRDEQCDGVPESVFAGTATVVTELPPQVLSVVQDLDVHVSRPWPRCTPGPANSYGQVLALLFSKPMLQTNANIPSAYQLDNGNYASGVQIQPGSRVALLSMREGVSAIRPRTMTVTGVTDARGNPNVISSQPVLTGFRDGVAVNTRVLRADGSPAINVPVTVTMYDPYKDPLDRCNPTIVTRTSQKYTDAQGLVTFDFVHGGVSFTVAAVDTGGLSVEAVTNLLGAGLRGDALFEAEKNAALLVRSNLLASLGVETVAEAMNFIEGLDRAVWSDTVDYFGGRMGGEIDVALRFRGRGVVAGKVLGPDGQTPEYLAAVNLFPDENSREQVRGVFTTTDGRFEFRGVPLGVFSIQVQTGRGHFRTVSGNLVRPGQTNELSIVLTAPTAQEVVRSMLRGRVVEPDGVTAVPRARVVVSYTGGVAALSESDTDGFFTATNLPLSGASGLISYLVRAVSQDGRRAGESSAVTLNPAGTAFATVTLRGTGVVIGRVELSTGLPATNALVSGGRTIVRTDSSGAFRLTDVPLGQAAINVGLEAQHSPGNLARLGSSSAFVLPGVDNFVVVRLPALGRIKGIVRDANGTPIVPAGQGNVAIPVTGGFMWTKVAPDGTFEFAGLAPEEYTVSAPAPVVEEEDDVQTIVGGAIGGTSDEILAAMRSAIDVINRSQALRYGELQPTTPGSFGFSRAQVRFDGDEAFVEVRYLPEGTVSGMVINDNEVPIGAKVRLTGLKLDDTGMPIVGILGNRTSDPAEGTFSFSRLPMGPWALQAASPFYPTVLVRNGQTTRDSLSISNVVLRFPSIRSVNGRLAGHVLLPGGAPAGANVNVQISFGTDYIIRTDADGFFDTQFNIPATGYTVEARDPVSGLRGQSQIQVTAGITNFGTVQLLGKGDLEIRVSRVDGSPAIEADVRATTLGYPGETFTGRTDTNGLLRLGNVFEGSYQVFASQSAGATRLEARTDVALTFGTTGRAHLVFGPVGTIRGIFRTLDGEPVAGARVDVGSIGSTATDSSGRFQVAGVGLGTYRVVARDPVSGRLGVAAATLTTAGQVLDIAVTELAQSDVNGVVFQVGVNGPLAGARVTLMQASGLALPRTVTTGPDGSFSFPAVIPGQVSVTALSSSGPTRAATVTLLIPDTATTVNTELRIPRGDPPIGALHVQVFDSDGVSPASNAVVRAGYAQAVTDENGRASFQLGYGSVFISAANRIAGSTMSAGFATTNISELYSNVTAQVRLSGVGRVRGVVMDSTGLIPRAAAEVRMLTRSAAQGIGGPLAQRTATAVTDAQGQFEFGDMAVGPLELTAFSGPLACSASGAITAPGQVLNVTLRLGDSGSVTGRLVQADGITPVARNLVAATYVAPSGLDGVTSLYTGDDGEFFLSGIPVGPLRIESLRLETLGIVRFDTALRTNGQVLDLGTLVMDEDWPAVISVLPAPATLGVSIFTPIDLTFSEPIATNTIPRNGIVLSDPSTNIPASVTWGPVTNGGTLSVRLLPLSPLRSLTTYRVSVYDGERKDGFGVTIGNGPRDMVGRALLQPFTSTFTTRDDDPPQLVSVFPTNGAVQIDPRAVPRFSFNEPVQASNAVVTLTGPAGPIPGTVEVGFNGLVLSFTPAVPLPVNAELTFSVSGVRDLAGNLATNQPYAIRFRSLDTVGPSLALFRIADGKSPVRNAPVELEVALAEPEPGASIRFTRDLAPIGVISNGVTRLPVVLPTGGSVIYRAIATDRYGNEGPLAELQLALVPDAPPVVLLSRAFPATGPIANGDSFSVNLAATDDVAVTNIVLQGPFGELARFPAGTPRIISLVMPQNAVAGTPFTLRARATDWIGSLSPEVTLDLTVLDRAPPVAAILSPAAGALLNIATPLQLAVSSSDNSTNYHLEARLSGPITATQTVAVVSAGNVPTTNTFLFSLTNIPTTGASLTATVRVFDAASNTVTLVRNFVVPDTRPPQLTTVSPAIGATNQSLWPIVRIDFDEPLDPLTVNTNTLAVTNNAGVPTPFAVALENNNQRVRISPAVALLPGTTYTNILLPALTDLAGNPWRQSAGAPVPAEGGAFPFTVARVLNITPTNASQFLLGQRVQASVAYESGFGATLFRFLVNGTQVAEVPAGPTNTSATLLMPTNGLAAEITILAANSPSFASAHAFQPIRVDLLPLTSDRDGDGMTDLFEITYDLNPFANDSAGDEDTDKLTNLQEFLAGTNPRNADTDADGIPDNLDPAPLSPNRAPVTDVVLVTNLNGSVTITLAGNDPDGDALVSRLTALPAVGGLFVTDDGVTRGSLVTNVPVVVTGAPPRVIYVGLGVAATNQVRYQVSDRFAQSPVAVLTFISTNNPAADADQDGMPDGFELSNNLNPLINDAALDPDADGLSSFQEFQLGTLPRTADTDADGLNDGAELARGTNPLNPDTDGDGIPDGSDPNPLGISSGLAFSGVYPVNVVEGTSTNLVLQVDSTNGPIVLLDYALTNLPPAFVSIKNLSFANTTSNGVATIELEFNPLHDAAGEHVITLRVANRFGESTTQDLRVVVANNPALGVTRWKEALSGNWSDPARWDNGLPNSTNVAVIDAAGTYTVNLNTSVNAAGIVLDSTNALVQLTAYLTLNAPTEVRRGRLDINTTVAFTLNRPLSNRDRMRWVSRYSVFSLQGTGWVENLGLWQIFPDPACASCSSESHINVPVRVTAGGTLALETNTFVNLAHPSGLTVAGKLEVQAGARLRLNADSGPAIWREVNLMAGSLVSGTGTIQIEGSSRLNAPGDLDTTVAIVLNGAAARLSVPGTYTVRASQNLGGIIEASTVVIASNAVTTAGTVNFLANVRLENGASLRLTAGTPAFGRHVLIMPGASLHTLSGSPTITLSGSLTNLGLMRWVSSYNVFTLAGPGRVENAGLWEIFMDPAANYSSESVLRLPVHVPPAGKLLLSTNAAVNFASGSNLSVEGHLEVQTGARLRFESASPARDLTLAPAAQLTGSGLIRVDGESRILAAGDLDTSVSILLNHTAARLIVPGTYTIRASQNLGGIIQASAINVASNAVLGVGTFNTSATITLQTNATLRLLGGPVHFGSNILVTAGARLDVLGSPTITLAGALTNLGLMRWVSAYNAFNLNGTGSVVNAGLWEIFRDPSANYGTESVVRVPVHVPAQGKLLLSSEAFLNFSAGSSLSVAGDLEIRNAARLHLDATNPGRDLTFLPGYSLAGSGTIQLSGASRLVAPGDLDTTIALVLNNAAARLVVPGTYTIRSSATLGGSLGPASVLVGTNASLTVNGGHFSGSMRLQQGASLLVNSGSITNQLVVESGANVRLSGGTVTLHSNVVVSTGARFDVNPSVTVVLNGSLTNRGEMRWVSAYNWFGLSGTGRLENEGLWQIYQDPVANYGTESVIRLPVNVPAGGKLLVSTNGFLNFSSGSSLTVAGELEVQTGGRLRLDATSPPRDLTLLAGSLLSGYGAIQIDGSCRMLVPGDLDTTVAVSLGGASAALIVPGTYTIRTSRTLSGAVASTAVLVTSNATLTANSAWFTGPVTVQQGAELIVNNGGFTNQLTLETGAAVRLTGGSVMFRTNVLVAAGARLDVPNSTTINLHGTLTNLGQMRWVSSYNTFHLNGTGRVQNAGLWHIFQDPAAAYLSESTVRVPVHVPTGATLLLSTNAALVFSSGSDLTIAGQLEVQAGARLRLDATNPARDLTLLPGSALSGLGSLHIEGYCRLLAPGDLDTTVSITMGSGATLIVPGVYTIRTSRTVGGMVSSTAVLLMTNATLTVNNAYFTGPVTLQDGASLLVNSGGFSNQLTLEPGATARLNAPVLFATNVLVSAGARLDALAAQITLHGVLTNHGEMRWVSAYNTFALAGSGSVHNSGLWQIYQDPQANYGYESTIRLPVAVPIGGMLSLSTNAALNLSYGSSLHVAGQLHIQHGARLRSDPSAPARDISLQTGTELSGLGTLQVEGASRLVVPADLDTTVSILVHNSVAGLAVPGTYTVRATGSLSGRVPSSAVVLMTNVTLTANNAHFSGPVTARTGSRLLVNTGSFTNQLSVEPGAALRFNGGSVSCATNIHIAPGALFEAQGAIAISLHGTLSNLGTMRWISAYNTFSLDGSGRVENGGLWEIYQDPQANYGYESSVRIPVIVPAGGTLLLTTNGAVKFSSGSSLAIAGALEVQTGARLRLDATTPPRTLALATGSSNTGSGTVLLEGGNRLVLNGDTTLEIRLFDFQGTSAINSSNTLVIAAGATVRFDHTTTNNGPVVVNGTLTLNNPSATLRINGTLALNATGTINNTGTISATAFINNGGQILGNPPLIIATSSPLLKLSISPAPSSHSTLMAATSQGGSTLLILKWQAAHGQKFTVQSTSDFRTWTPLAVVISEPTPGSFEAPLPSNSAGGRFYRLRID